MERIMSKAEITEWVRHWFDDKTSGMAIEVDDWMYSQESLGDEEEWNSLVKEWSSKGLIDIARKLSKNVEGGSWILYMERVVTFIISMPRIFFLGFPVLEV